MNAGDRQRRAERFNFAEAFGVPPEEVRGVICGIVRHFRQTGRTWILEVTPYGRSVMLGDGSEVMPWVGVLIQKEPVDVIIAVYFREMPDAQGLGEILMSGMLLAESVPGRVIVQDQMFEPSLAPFTDHLKIRILHQAERLEDVRGVIQLHIAGIDEREIVDALDEDNNADSDLSDEIEDLLDKIAALPPPTDEHWILHFMQAPFTVRIRHVGDIHPWIGIILATHDPSPRVVATLPFKPDQMHLQATLLDHMLHEETVPGLLNVVDPGFRDWLEPIRKELGFEISDAEEVTEFVAPVLERVLKNIDRKYVEEGVWEIMSRIEGDFWTGVG